jgi:hypothetical protein
MRQDKTVARILLIFFIANVVLAAPLLVRQRRLVTDRRGDEPMGEPKLDNPPSGFHQGSRPNTGALQSHDYLPQQSELGNWRLQGPPQDRPNQYKWWPHSVWRPPATLVAEDSSHKKLPPALENRPLRINRIAYPETSAEGIPLEIFPEKLEAYPPDGNQLYHYEVQSVTFKDVDDASPMSWAAEPPSPVWEKEEVNLAKFAGETHLHL